MSQQLRENAKLLAQAITKWVNNRPLNWREESILRHTLGQIESYQLEDNRSVDEIVTYGISPYRQPQHEGYEMYQLPGGHHQHATQPVPVKQEGGFNWTPLVLFGGTLAAGGIGHFVLKLF